MDIDKIKLHMKSNKITYEQLAELSGVSLSAIKKIFSGVAQYPRVDTMEAIEKALQLDKHAPTETVIFARGGNGPIYPIPVVSLIYEGKKYEYDLPKSDVKLIKDMADTLKAKNE